MAKQRGRPKTSNRVRVSIMLDPDLVDWSRQKRSDMVNRLLRKQKNRDDVEFEFLYGSPLTHELIIKSNNDGNEHDPV